MEQQRVQREIQRIRRTNTAIFLTFALLAAVAAAAFGLWQYRRSFTPERWEALPEERWRMVGSLTAQHPLVGLTEEAVLTLLGEEDSQQTSFKISRESFPPETTLVYCLGVSYIDTEWLILSLEEGKVARSCINVS